MLANTPYDVFNKVPMTCYPGPKGSKLFLVNTMHEFHAFYEELMKQTYVACDTETSGFHYFGKDRIVGMSFGWGLTHFYLPVRHVDSLLGGVVPGQLDMDVLRPYLQAFFAQKEVTTIWHNAKFDFHFYRVDGIEISTIFHDTLNGWRLYDENAPASLKTIATGWRDPFGRWVVGLIGKGADRFEKEVSQWRSDEAVARRKAFTALVLEKADELENQLEYQGMKRNVLKKHIKEKVLHTHPYCDVKKDQIHYGMIPLALMAQYAATDTFLTLLVYQQVLAHLKQHPEQVSLYVTEMKLTRVLMETEHSGVLIKRKHLVSLKDKFAEDIAALEVEIKKELSAPELNLNSSKQLAEALLLNNVELTETTENEENYKLDKEVLSGLASSHPIIQKVLDYRELQKLQSTYVTGILEKITPDDILHCTYNQMVSTGRMSCSDPNLQNIPGGSNAEYIRAAFANLGPDYVYIFADYSQIELRLTAHYSEDPIMLDAFHRGQDLHMRAMCEMFGIDYEFADKVLKDPSHEKYKEFKDLRTVAKRINFGIIYGVGAPGLAAQTKKSVEECERFIELYLRTYIGVKRMMNKGKREVRANGFVSNRFGRIRNLPHTYASKILPTCRAGFTPEEIQKEARWLQSRADRQAVNFGIQGEAADLFKTAVVNVFDLFQTSTKGSRLVNFVHDEIQAYVHKDELFLLPQMKRVMEDFQYAVPIVVEFEWSEDSWGAKKPIHL